MKLYQIILEDNEFLDIEFVSKVLIEIFRVPFDEIEIMLDALKLNGFLIMDVLPFQFAETKVIEMHHAAQSDRVYIQCSFEEVNA